MRTARISPDVPPLTDRNSALMDDENCEPQPLLADYDAAGRAAPVFLRGGDGWAGQCAYKSSTHRARPLRRCRPGRVHEAGGGGLRLKLHRTMSV